MLESEDVDFVDIATRPDTHLPLGEMCVERGLPVIDGSGYGRGPHDGCCGRQGDGA